MCTSSSLLCSSREVAAVHHTVYRYATAYCVSDNAIEAALVLFHEGRGFLVKRIVRIHEFREEQLQALQNGRDGIKRFPIVSEHVQTNLPLLIDVWMINLTGEVDEHADF